MPFRRHCLTALPCKDQPLSTTGRLLGRRTIGAVEVLHLEDRQTLRFEQDATCLTSSNIYMRSDGYRLVSSVLEGLQMLVRTKVPRHSLSDVL
jgi:hypothetical protein